MDRCKCWQETKVILTIEHCPSLAHKVHEELDKLIQFTQKQTDLLAISKVRFYPATDE